MASRSLFLLFLMVASAGLSGPAIAHEFTEPECFAPSRPVDDQNDAAWQDFLDDIDEFRACTAKKMERHEAAVLDHQESARLAVAAWNEFVRTSLNAPEDFPWPPED